MRFSRYFSTTSSTQDCSVCAGALSGADIGAST
jgi:hypothetical protein